MPREYIYKSDEDDIIEKIDVNLSVEKIRNENWMYFDNSSYWAIKKGENIYYSNDDTFYTDKLDSTHIVIFLK